jgi:hypothetical protein
MNSRYCVRHVLPIGQCNRLVPAEYRVNFRAATQLNLKVIYLII